MYKLMKGSAVALSLSAFLVGCGEKEQAQESVDSTTETASSAQNRPRAIFRRFFDDLARFFVDFRSIFRRISQDVGTNLALNPFLSSAQFLCCCVARACRNG